jgi:two-component system NtrC family response regulator
MIALRTFREDLFYRINLITIHLPPLRERKDDIPLLAHHFAAQQTQQNHLPKAGFTEAAYDYLSRLPFPGNVRELKNLVERTLLISGKTLIDASDIMEQTGDKGHAAPPAPLSPERYTLDELEKQSILRALETHGGNLSHTAKSLGISRAALYRRMEKYGIHSPNQAPGL